LAILRLKKDEDRRIRAGHLWVFSNEIDVRETPLVELEPGQPVEVQDFRGSFLGTGYANPRSLITARLLSRKREEALGPEILTNRLARALSLREHLYPTEPYYRMCFGEGDGLPGLVVDRYGDVLVVQATTAGIERVIDDVVAALVELVSPEGILLRADSPARELEGIERYVRTAYGDVPETTEIVENGSRFRVPLQKGQKTGWFYDHRSNRARLAHYATRRRVLDVFSYAGGWGVQAAVSGAAEAVFVDSSTAALQLVEVNAELNGISARVDTIEGDAFEVLDSLRQNGNHFDVIVLDPPAFIKRRKDLKQGEQAYRKLNRSALELLTEGGILASASCSFHLSREMLLRSILWAAERTGREIQVVEEGHQAPDHPFHPAIPETNYLKAFFVRVLR
jgi:23S rRNA (cytosine1962-C5)-methyltransferase